MSKTTLTAGQAASTGRAWTSKTPSSGARSSTASPSIKKTRNTRQRRLFRGTPLLTGGYVARFLWGSATTLLVAVLVLLFISLPEVGDPPMTLLHPGFPLVEDGVAAPSCLPSRGWAA